MPDKPKLLTRAEWEAYKRTHFPMPGTEGGRVIATLDALFRYRERTRGLDKYICEDGSSADDVAAKLGIK